MADIIKFSPRPTRADPSPYLALYMDEDVTVELIDGKVRATADVAALDKAIVELCEVVDTLEHVRADILLKGRPDPFSDLPGPNTGTVSVAPISKPPTNDNQTP